MSRNIWVKPLSGGRLTQLGMLATLGTYLCEREMRGVHGWKSLALSHCIPVGGADILLTVIL